MLKRPSSRRRSNHAEVSLNLVPMLDALVTMISFLMYTMAFLSLTMVESPLPMVSQEENIKQLKEPPLQLTLTVNDNDLLVWSPFDKIEKVTIPNIMIRNDQTGKEEPSPDLIKLHETLIGIKQKFPNETKLLMVPKQETSYDTIVTLIDAAKNLEKTDIPIVIKNEKTGIEEQAKSLFPDVIFGNLLESN
jgi:biopolymer transport protein ExbD